MKNKKPTPYSEVLLQVGQRLKELRKNAGYKSYEHIAYDLEMSRSAYWRLEKGNNFELKTLIKVCVLLNVSLEDFFEGVNFPKPSGKLKRR